MATLKDLTGQRFGKLFVLRRADSTPDWRTMWRVRCDCGTEKDVKGDNLKAGSTTSCGCNRIALRKTHGLYRTPTYYTWRAIISRCTDPKARNYPYYGGRGITLCDRWRQSFKAFHEDVGTRPDGMTLDRIDVNGNYEPGNVRWATKIEQEANKRPIENWRKPNISVDF